MAEKKNILVQFRALFCANSTFLTCALFCTSRFKGYDIDRNIKYRSFLIVIMLNGTVHLDFTEW